uniref:Bactericidal permeability-increasing protein n=1 Tax=Takifugu rubripes TaxID=31033 RepID=A0A674NS58_TAKRU
MFLCGWLVMVTLIPVILSVNPGVEVKITDKGIEYGRQLGIAAIQEKLKKIRIPDFSGKQRVSPIGKVQYSLTNIQIVNIGLPIAPIQLVPGSGVKLSINNAFINLRGNWRVKFLRWVKNSGSFEVGMNDLSISESLAVKSDSTGRPEVSTISCAASVGRVRIKFHGGASWLYNLFSKYIEKALKSALQKQICPLVTNAIDDMNPRLKTLNVLANVDKYAEIEYSMVSSPAISSSSIALKLKGQFYNIGQHQEPPFSAPAFSLPPENSNMLYMALSAFTANSAAFVYHKAGVLSIYITDDMIPKRSPIRLTTTTFGTFIPQISKQFPGLMMKLLMKTDKSPVVTFEPDRVTVQVTGTVTAYAIQPNDTLTPLFILNLDTSVSSKVFLSGMKLGVSLTLNKMKLSLQTSYVGQFQVRTLSNSLEFVLKWVVIPVVNGELLYFPFVPLMCSLKLHLTTMFVLGPKYYDYMLIGTDVKFTG